MPAVILSLFTLARLALFWAFSRLRCSLWLTCCIPIGQRYPFRGSTAAPRQYLGAPGLPEQRKNGLGKSYFAAAFADFCPMAAWTSNELDLKPRTSRQKGFDGLRLIECIAGLPHIGLRHSEGFMAVTAVAVELSAHWGCLLWRRMSFLFFVRKENVSRVRVCDVCLPRGDQKFLCQPDTLDDRQAGLIYLDNANLTKTRTKRRGG